MLGVGLKITSVAIFMEAGGGGGAPWWPDDGSAAAPTGTPQYPSLFSGYATRPPWKVAGVDYYVGIDRSKYPTDAALKPISSITAADAGPNFYYNGTDSLRIFDPNVVLDGWDFTNGNNGAGVCVQLGADASSPNMTVTNCKFAVGTNQNPIFNQSDLSAGQTTFKYCSFDAHGRTDTLNSVILNLNGGVVLEWCHLTNGSQDEIDYGIVNVIRFNLIDNPGLTGGHADWIQLGGGITGVSQTVDFNTWVQNGAGSSQGVGLYPGTSGNFSATLLEFNFNTAITYTANAQPKYIWSVCFNGAVTGGGTVTNIGTINCQHNFVDPSGTLAGVDAKHGFETFGTLQTGTTFNFSGNINMVDGSTISANL